MTGYCEDRHDTFSSINAWNLVTTWITNVQVDCKLG